MADDKTLQPAEQQKDAVAGNKLTRINNLFMGQITDQLERNEIEMTPYAKNCVLHAISAINRVIEKAGLNINSDDLDRSTITDVLLKIAALQLNASASPREVYFQTRKEKTTGKDGKPKWMTKVEMGIEGDGNDSILARFGRDVEEIGQIWKVREGDDFSYPRYSGLDMIPPQWTPKGQGKIVRVVYPVIKHGKDGKRYVEFYIAEREDVMTNLMAHINNNLMNETFGLAKNRYEADPAQQKEIAARKKEIIDHAKTLTLEAALDDEGLQPYISDAWSAPHSREAMIERKMRNNAIKKIPKDFGNGMIETLFEDTFEDVPRSELRAPEMASLPAETKKRDPRLKDLNRELQGEPLEDIIDE